MLYLGEEGQLLVGQSVQIDCASPEYEDYAVVFEDDGETGYFYALDYRKQAQPIMDAVHIYNVEAVSDKEIPSTVQIAWHHQGRIAVLFINQYPHAAFDFTEKIGLNRSGFPEAGSSGWQRALLVDEQVKLWHEAAE